MGVRLEYHETISRYTAISGHMPLEDHSASGS